MKIDWEKTLIITTSCCSSIGAVSLWSYVNPIYGCLWFLSWSFLQFTLWQKFERRRKLIEQLKEIDRVALERLRAMDEPIFEALARESFHAQDFAVIRVSEMRDCNNCKYFYGNYSIVCALHPSGYQSDSCGDRCDAK